MNKPRVLMIVDTFPQISKTYMFAEINAIKDDYDLRVVCFDKPNLPCKNHYPYQCLEKLHGIRELIEDFRPHVIHTHYLLHHVKAVLSLAKRYNIPFTMRTHSYDVLPFTTHGKKVHKRRGYVNHELCLGVLAFPFARPHLEKAGIRPDKLIDCWPVIDYARFHQRGPVGDAVMNVGACLPKKRMEDFIDLAKGLPAKKFNLYPLGYTSDQIVAYNQQHGSPVSIEPTIQPEDMPAQYKRHGWLVYTGCVKAKTVGWPMAIAEAQAMGLGVCMPNLRPDVREYVGKAGFVYDSISELPAILSRPYPQEMREIGYEHARKSDIQQHKHLLTDMWDKAATSWKPKESLAASIARMFTGRKQAAAA